MAQEQTPHDLSRLLDQVKTAGGDPETVTIGDVRERLGRRSFGPLLLFIGLVLLTPLAGIPGLPTTFGLIVMLIAGQMLLGLEGLWLPQVVLRRSIPRRRLEQFDNVARHVARYIDRIIRPRWPSLTERPLSDMIAVLCFFSGLIMLPLEFVPFTSSIPGLPVAAFGLALTTRDGLFVLVGVFSVAVIVGATVVLGSAIL